MTTMKTCPLCEQTFNGFGNNPAPFDCEGKSCCDTCNGSFVIPARFYLATHDPDNDCEGLNLTINGTTREYPLIPLDRVP